MELSMKKYLGLAVVLALAASPAIAATAFKITKLDSDIAGKAMHLDANLVNPWGMSQVGSNPIWVSDNGTGLSTLYDQGTGVVVSLVVTIPGGAPTGTVYNSTTAFQISENGRNGAAAFLFDSEAGIISGWNSSVDGTNAVVGYDGSANGSVYKGLAIDTSKKLLFATDFANNQVQVLDGSWTVTKSFTDKSLKGYAPFNVALIGGKLYVAFAKQGKVCCDEKRGAGLGAVDVFDENGNLLQQLVATGGDLNAPWGLTVAPSSWNEFAGSLLVGNFGNGWINAYDINTGASLGTLNGTTGSPITIKGLWGLDPVPANDVTFTAGIQKEAHGLMGLIKVAQ
jgi:uncharacterized protein (TIGR03118 family)